MKRKVNPRLVECIGGCAIERFYVMLLSKSLISYLDIYLFRISCRVQKWPYFLVLSLLKVVGSIWTSGNWVSLISCCQVKFKNSGRPCQLACTGLACTGLVSRNFWIWSGREISETQTSNEFLGGLGIPNQEMEIIFELSIKFCIGRAQKPTLRFS